MGNAACSHWFLGAITTYLNPHNSENTHYDPYILEEETETLEGAMTGLGHHPLCVAEARTKSRPVIALQIMALNFHQAFFE